MRSRYAYLLFSVLLLAATTAQADDSTNEDALRVGIGAGGNYFWQSNGQSLPGQSQNIGEAYGMGLLSLGQRLTLEFGLGISANVQGNPHPLYLIARAGALYGKDTVRAGGMAWVEHSISNTTFSQDRLIVGPAAQIALIGGLRLEGTAGYLHHFVSGGQPAQDGFGLLVMLSYISR